MDKNVCGVYKITSPSNRHYIGSSVDIKYRWANYKILSQSKSQIKLHRSFNKYGILNHTFEIIEECEEALLLEKERYWQEFYNVLEDGLNCRYVNTKEKRGKDSDETREKKRIALSGGNHYKAKAVECSKTGKIWESVGELAKEIGMHRDTLGDKLKNKVRNTTPYFFVSDKYRVEEVCNQEKGTPFAGKIVRRGKDSPLSKAIICTVTGKIWSSITECAEENNINMSTLSYNLKMDNKNKTPFRYYHVSN